MSTTPKFSFQRGERCHSILIDLPVAHHHLPPSVMRLNGLESLYGLDMRRSEEMTAKDIMETDLKVVPCQTTVCITARQPV